MKLFDLHCDTISEMKKGGFGFEDNPLHISGSKASDFSPYIQVCAVWTDSSLSDGDAWTEFFKVTDHFRGTVKTDYIKNSASLRDTAEKGGRGFILACEGARLLCGDIDRLDRLYAEGVRVLTLVWAGSDIIGGAHGTDDPLTPFGKQVVEKCFDIGIIPDISHASRASAKEVLDIAASFGKAPCATHSNSYSLHSHQRNLTDGEFSYIISLGGIVGVSLCPEHLAAGGAAVGDIVRHIMYYINKGGISSVALGCDFDGIGTVPDGICDISCLDRLYYALCSAGLSEDEAEQVFFANAYRFMMQNL